MVNDDKSKMSLGGLVTALPDCLRTMVVVELLDQVQNDDLAALDNYDKQKRERYLLHQLDYFCTLTPRDQFVPSFIKECMSGIMAPYYCGSFMPPMYSLPPRPDLRSIAIGDFLGV